MKFFLKTIYFKYIIVTLIAFFIAILYHIINNSWLSVSGNCNAFFISGAAMILFSFLTICVNLGSLDIFSYMFVNHKKEENKTFYDYCENKKEKRKKTSLNFLPYLFVGLVFIVIALIFFIIFKVTVNY